VAQGAVRIVSIFYSGEQPPNPVGFSSLRTVFRQTKIPANVGWLTIGMIEEEPDQREE
jgi:hypothetical protein